MLLQREAPAEVEVVPMTLAGLDRGMRALRR